MKEKLNALKTKYDAMSEPVKASLWYTVSNVMLKGIALLSTPIFTRIMSQAQYGSYSVYQSWYAIFSIITTLNLFQGGFNKGMMRYEKDRDGFISSQVTLMALMVLGWAGVYFLNTDFWDNLIGLTPPLMAAMFIELWGVTTVEFWSARERFDFKYRRYVFVSSATTILSISIGIVTVLLSEDKVMARVYSDVFAKVIFGAVLFIPLLLRGKKLFCWEYWKYGLCFNLPLMPHFFSTFILHQADRIMIDNMVGSAEAACYSIAYAISSMMQLITDAINKALIPYIYRMIGAERVADVRKNTKGLFVLVGVLAILVMSFAPEIILVFAGRDYMEAMWIIPPVAGAMYFIFCYNMFSTFEYYFQRTGMIAVASCVCAVLNIILNYIFISLFGYQAAGYTTLFCYIMLALLHYTFYKKIIKTEIPEQGDVFDMKFVVLVSVGVLVTMGVILVVYRVTILRYALLASILLLGIVKRKWVIAQLKNLKA